MVGVILISGFVLCALILLVVLFYFKHSEISITDKAVDISKVIPIQTIAEDAIINGNGDISIGYRMFLPEVFSLSKEETEHIHERLEGLFKMLPAGSVIHQQNYYYTNTYRNEDYSTNPLTLENLQNYDGREVLCSYTNMYLTFVNTDIKKQVRRSATTTSLLRKINFPYKQTYKDYDKKLSEMESVILNFEQGLNSITKIVIKRMDSAELNNAVFDYLNLSYNEPTGDATKETLNPIETDNQGNMKIGNKLIAVLSLTREGDFLKKHATPNTGKSKAFGTRVELPENIKSKCSMIYPVGLGLPFNHIVNVIIEVTDTDSTVSVINAEKQALNYIAPFYPPAKEKQKEQEAFCNEIGQFEHQTSYMIKRL